MFFILSIICILFLNIRLYILKEYKELSINFILFIGLFFLFWTILNQDISNILNYIFGIFVFSSGYNEAMAIYESTPISILGISTALLVLLNIVIWLKLCLKNKILNKQNIQIFLSIIFNMLLIFLSWKLGFVRADQHVLIFFVILSFKFLLFIAFIQLL